MTGKTPTPPLPEPLRGNEPGTWAEETLKERMPDIGRRAANERDWPPAIKDALARLADDVPFGMIDALDDSGAPDLDAWRTHVAPHKGMRWLDVPWFFAEAYFYRRMLAASGYFREGPTRSLDPFGPEKQRGLAQGLGDGAQADGRGDLEDLVLAALWGNRADMSIWPTQPGGRDADAPDQQRIQHLLVDDRPALLSHLSQLPHGPRRVDVVLDNAGKELLEDLALARFILDTWDACRLVLHVKPHPTFVSDVIESDLSLTLDQAAAAGGRLAEMTATLDAARVAGRLVVATDGFWTSPLPGWEMPGHLAESLARSDLVIFKGDANYRRLLGDRHWSFTTPLADIVGYFPAPLLCLRTLKADVAAGLDAGLIERASSTDPDWMTDGRWAVIQFAERSLAEVM